jgi:hypothetical protein
MNVGPDLRDNGRETRNPLSQCSPRPFHGRQNVNCKPVRSRKIDRLEIDVRLHKPRHERDVSRPPVKPRHDEL